MKRPVRGGAAMVVATSAMLVLAFGCVKEDPIVTGKRDASAEAKPKAGTAVSPLADEADNDLADCRHCAETLSVQSARDVLCRKNGPPSSARLLNEVVDCVCYDKCVPECGTYCAGAAQAPSCQACVLEKCTTVVDACLGDTKP